MLNPRRSACWMLALLVAASLGGTPASAEDDRCQCKDLVVRCKLVPSQTVLVGDEFCIEVEVENVNQLPLEEVLLRIRPCKLAKCTDPSKLELKIPKLDVGETREF